MLFVLPQAALLYWQLTSFGWWKGHFKAPFVLVWAEGFLRTDTAYTMGGSMNPMNESQKGSIFSFHCQLHSNHMITAGQHSASALTKWTGEIKFNLDLTLWANGSTIQSWGAPKDSEETWNLCLNTYRAVASGKNPPCLEPNEKCYLHYDNARKWGMESLYYKET